MSAIYMSRSMLTNASSAKLLRVPEQPEQKVLAKSGQLRSRPTNKVLTYSWSGYENRYIVRFYEKSVSFLSLQATPFEVVLAMT